MCSACSINVDNFLFLLNESFFLNESGYWLTNNYRYLYKAKILFSHYWNRDDNYELMGLAIINDYQQQWVGKSNWLFDGWNI